MGSRQISENRAPVFIEGRLATKATTTDRGDAPEDLLDALLEMRSDVFTPTDTKSYLADIFGAGTDTTANTMEWSMAELFLCDPFGTTTIQTSSNTKLAFLCGY